MSAQELKLYEMIKRRFNEEDATMMREYFETKTDQKILEKRDIFLTKDDKVDIIKSIYLADVVQFVAMIASVLAIVKLLVA